MVDKTLGPSASQGGLEAISLGVPPMSKAERLHRWADNLELRKQLRPEAGDDAAFHTCEGSCSTRADSSPLTVAFEDWAFQAEGLRGDGVGDALAFFDLSESEMLRIIGSFDGSRPIPTAVAAERVRALARQAEATPVPHVGEHVAGGLVAASIRGDAWSSSVAGSVAGSRRKKGAAGTAPRGSKVVRRGLARTRLPDGLPV